MAPEEPIIIVPYDPHWPGEFREIGQRLRSALGGVAVRIDHIGSTSVPGLDAKPVIDIQVSVPSFEPEARILSPLAAIQFRYEPDNPDRTKRFFLGPEGTRRIHVHVRRVGSVDEQLVLLFRDYLRAHPDPAREYARVKWALAEKFRNDRPGYVLAKGPTVWSLLGTAHDWAQETGWTPGPSDA